MTAPPVGGHRRRHRRRRRHDGRGRRSGRGRRRRGAGSQSKSRKKSGRAERPASRDKTHVSPPRVESDTLHQLDTQSRAAQDIGIIASSRLFSMGNLTPNGGNDDDPDLWRGGAAQRQAQYHPPTTRRNRHRMRETPSKCPIHPHRRRRTPRAVRGVRDGRATNGIGCPARQNFTGRDWDRYVVLGARDLRINARTEPHGTRHGGDQPLPSPPMSRPVMHLRHSSHAMSHELKTRRPALDAVVLATPGDPGAAIRRRTAAWNPDGRPPVIPLMTDGRSRRAPSDRSGSGAKPRARRRADHSISRAARRRGLVLSEIR